MLLAQNCTNLMDFLLEYYIQFFCLEKPIGITLGCLEWPKPMLLPLNCILIVSMGILHTVFLSQETHRLNIGLSQVAKSYAFALNCMNSSFNYYFKSATLNSLILTIIYPSNRLILLCQEFLVRLYIHILFPGSRVAINLGPYRFKVHH